MIMTFYIVICVFSWSILFLKWLTGVTGFLLFYILFFLSKFKNVFDFEGSLLGFVFLNISVDAHDFSLLLPWLRPDNDLDWAGGSLISNFVIDSLYNLSLNLNDFFQIASIGWWNIRSCFVIGLQEIRLLHEFFQFIWVDSMISTSLNRINILPSYQKLRGRRPREVLGLRCFWAFGNGKRLMSISIKVKKWL